MITAFSWATVTGLGRLPSSSSVLAFALFVTRCIVGACEGTRKRQTGRPKTNQHDR